MRERVHRCLAAGEGRKERAPRERRGEAGEASKQQQPISLCELALIVVCVAANVASLRVRTPTMFQYSIGGEPASTEERAELAEFGALFAPPPPAAHALAPSASRWPLPWLRFAPSWRKCVPCNTFQDRRHFGGPWVTFLCC